MFIVNPLLKALRLRFKCIFKNFLLVIQILLLLLKAGSHIVFAGPVFDGI